MIVISKDCLITKGICARHAARSGTLISPRMAKSKSACDGFVQCDGGGKASTNEQQPAHQAHQAHQEGGCGHHVLFSSFAHVTLHYK
jgi:hypothetical protein